MTPYHEFYPGAKVVCIDAKYKAEQRVAVPCELVEGAIYTIRWVGPFVHYLDGEFIGIKVEEIMRGEDPEFGYDDMPFAARRFRPLVKDRLATFRSVAAGGPIQGDFEEPKRVKKKEEERV